MLKFFFWHVTGRDVKNVPMWQQCWCKKNSILGKIFAKFYTVLSRKLIMSQFCAFWWHFLANFLTLCYVLSFFCTIWVFWAFYAVLSQVILVVIYALFWVKYFWLKPCLCNFFCLFACLVTGDTWHMTHDTWQKLLDEHSLKFSAP